MATPAQIRANRANAQHSSGPRSDAGRQITKMNALKHGLAARELVIKDEDPAALEALRADLRAEHAPANQTEALLVEDLAICWWRLQRGRKYEAAAINGGLQANRPFTLLIMDRMLRYTAAAERAWNRALANLRTAQNGRRKRELSNTEPEASPQPQETEKVIAIGSVLQNDSKSPDTEPGPAPEASPLTTNHEPLTTEIGSVLQNDPDPAEQAARIATIHHEILVPRARVDEVIAVFDLERSIQGVGKASVPAQGLLAAL